MNKKTKIIILSLVIPILGIVMLLTLPRYLPKIKYKIKYEKYERDIYDCISSIKGRKNILTSDMIACESRIKRDIKLTDNKIKSRIQVFTLIELRYEEILKIYYDNIADEIGKKLNDVNKSYRGANDYKLYSYPEYRIENNQTTYCGIGRGSQTTYYTIGKDLIEIYSIGISSKMEWYRWENYKNYFYSMDRIDKYKIEIIAHLNDDRCYLNKYHMEATKKGDYLSQQRYKEDIDKITQLINQLNNCKFKASIGYCY